MAESPRTPTAETATSTTPPQASPGAAEPSTRAQRAEILHVYEQRVPGETTEYVARACGREAEDGRWEGWIEFVPTDAGAVLRSARETVQPNREDLVYWVTGLTPVNLEGSLARTVEPPPRPAAPPPPGRPAYEGPAPRTATPSPDNAVIDPFTVHAHGGEDLLRRELGALAAWHLRHVIRAWRLADESTVDLEALDHGALAERIVAAVRERRLGGDGSRAGQSSP